MVRPSVVAADIDSRTGRVEGSAEIRHRELGHLIAQALNEHFLVKRAHRLAQLCKQPALAAILSVMRIETV